MKRVNDFYEIMRIVTCRTGVQIQAVHHQPVFLTSRFNGISITQCSQAYHTPVHSVSRTGRGKYGF